MRKLSDGVKIAFFLTFVSMIVCVYLLTKEIGLHKGIDWSKFEQSTSQDKKGKKGKKRG